MARKTQTIEQLDASIKRWKTRLRRAVNTLGTLEKKRNRLAAKATVAKHLDPVLEQLNALTIRPKAVQVARIAHATVMDSAGRASPPSDPTINSESANVAPDPEASTLGTLPPAQPTPDLDIPEFLRRGQAAQKAVDAVIADQIREQQAATKVAKSRGRIATMKAKKSGETRKMPLTGKAALAAIRGE